MPYACKTLTNAWSIYTIRLNNWLALIPQFFSQNSGHLFSVQFSHSVMSDSLWHHGLQHARPPCPSPTPGIYSNSFLSSQWCHPTISSSVVPFPSYFQSLPASGSFQMSQFFTSEGQSFGVSASASVLLMNKYSGLISFRINWLELLAAKELSRIFFNTTVQKHQFFDAQLSL